MNLTEVSTGLTGYALVSVIDHNGKTIRELPPIRNLWLDQGLDRLPDVLIADAFAVAIKGSGQVATKETPANTNTYTLAGSTITRTAGTRAFTGDDVGKLIRSANGREAIVSAYTDATHVDVMGVGLNALVAYTTQTVVIYSVNLKGLTSEAFQRITAGTISKTEGDSTITLTTAGFTAADVGKAIFVSGDIGDPYAARYLITAYLTTTTVTVSRTDGGFAGRTCAVYTPRAGGDDLAPLSRTDVCSAVPGENSTTDTGAPSAPTGERVMKRTLIFAPEPEVIEYKSSNDAGTYTWNATTVTRTAGARAFTALDVGKYLKFSTNEFCKITAYTSATVVTVDRAPKATITNGTVTGLYGNNSYDGIGFSDSDDPTANANIIVRLESAGASTPVIVAGANPELPGQQLKVTYVCKASVAPVTITARANAGITDTANVMGSNKFGTSVVEGLALSGIDLDGSTISTFAVLEPAEPGLLALSPSFSTLLALKLPDRSAGVVTTDLAPVGYNLGDFSQLYEGTFGINDAIAANWRTMGIYDLDTNAFAYTWLFEANQAKSGQVLILIRFRKSWNRDLS